jgi:hypothetical protein
MPRVAPRLQTTFVLPQPPGNPPSVTRASYWFSPAIRIWPTASILPGNYLQQLRHLDQQIQPVLHKNSAELAMLVLKSMAGGAFPRNSPTAPPRTQCL